MSSLRLALKLSMMPDEESKEEAAKLEKDNNKDKEKALLPNTKRKRSASELSSDMSVTKPGRTDGIAIGTNSKSKKEKMDHDNDSVSSKSVIKGKQRSNSQATNDGDNYVTSSNYKIKDANSKSIRSKASYSSSSDNLMDIEEPSSSSSSSSSSTTSKSKEGLSRRSSSSSLDKAEVKVSTVKDESSGSKSSSKSKAKGEGEKKALKIDAGKGKGNQISSTKSPVVITEINKDDDKDHKKSGTKGKKDKKEKITATPQVVEIEKKEKEKVEKLDYDSALEIPGTSAASPMPTNNDDANHNEVSSSDGAGAVDTDANTPRYKSSRAAAELAKARISNKGPAASDIPVKAEGVESPRRTNSKGTSAKAKKDKAQLTPVVPEKPWACCDTCGKWRQLPHTVSVENLPDQWYCHMNQWDEFHNTCDAPEEEATEPAEDYLVMTMTGSPRTNAKVGKGNKDGVIMTTDSVINDGTPSDTEHGRRNSSRLRGNANQVPYTPQVAVVQVDWVQCNKCTKWRKVPQNISVNDLPDVWYCTMNTWNPAVARCSAREEKDDTPLSLPPLAPINDGTTRPYNTSAKGRPGPGRKSLNHSINAQNNYNITGNAQASNTAPVIKKKVTQWVQCERKNCKKWRKVPPQINMDSLPEKWYCEMNTWDLDRATCDFNEDTDSDTENPTGVVENTRNQLILANSKGPGSLSYRRIIFGADGRLRPVYSEKARNGYGLFSFTEAHRSANQEEYIEPTRRLGYWWSNSFDSNGINFYTTSKRENYAKKMANREELQHDKNRVIFGDWKSVDGIPQRVESSHSNSLLNAACRVINNTSSKNDVSLSSSPPSSSSSSASIMSIPTHKEKHIQGTCKALHNMTILERQYIESIVVRSCLMGIASSIGKSSGDSNNNSSNSSSKNSSLSTSSSSVTPSSAFSYSYLTSAICFQDLESVLFHARFHDLRLEACRLAMSIEDVKAVIRRLEEASEIEVTFSVKGEILIHLLAQEESEEPMDTFAPELSSNANSVPLKFRKAFNKMI